MMPAQAEMPGAPASRPTKSLLVTQQLENGLQLEFEDLSNRYYGDYHRVCISIYCRLAEDDYQERYLFTSLEKMAVAGGELAAVKQQLMEQFDQRQRSYLARPDFPRRFLAARRLAGARRGY
ncbi:hypothetical protein [Desulfuromonas thiophila]|uniref:hypothetical protein n=1 Tax=Desulfuromonas thiophila TaxID=57664 RepID=UPI0024A9CEBF|nr:hypothetical protein [Desulfuromonas thiophila]